MIKSEEGNSQTNAILESLMDAYKKNCLEEPEDPFHEFNVKRSVGSNNELPFNGQSFQISTQQNYSEISCEPDQSLVDCYQANKKDYQTHPKTRTDVLLSQKDFKPESLTAFTTVGDYSKQIMIPEEGKGHWSYEVLLRVSPSDASKLQMIERIYTIEKVKPSSKKVASDQRAGQAPKI